MQQIWYMMFRQMWLECCYKNIMYSWQILKQWCKGHFVFFHSFILFKLRLSLRYCFSISIGFLFRCHCVCLKLKISHMRIFSPCFSFNNKDVRTIDLFVPWKITFSSFSFFASERLEKTHSYQSLSSLQTSMYCKMFENNPHF